MENAYEIITKKIIEKIEKEGVLPWKKPWGSFGSAVNYVTQKRYRGINQWILEPGEYLSFLGITQQKGKLAKGSKGNQIIFFKMLEVEDRKTGKPKDIPFAQITTIFNIMNTNLKPRRQPSVIFNHDPIERAEEVVQQYVAAGGPRIKTGSERACYIPSLHLVEMPDISRFKRVEDYYTTLFHELTHSTMSVLNRQPAKPAPFGSEDYSKEEAVAQIGAELLCSEVGIQSDIDNSSAYIKGWIQALKNDSKLIISAASAAEKAVQYILSSQVSQGLAASG